MKVNELVRKLASSKAGRLMIEEADRRDKQLAEDERQATEYAAIIAGRPALAERFAERHAAVDEKMEEIISRHKADYRQVEELRVKQTSVHNDLAACDRAEIAQRRLNGKRFPLLPAFWEQIVVVVRHVSAEHVSRFNVNAQKALQSFRQAKIATGDPEYAAARKKLEDDEAEAKKGLAIQERLKVARDRIGELELEITPAVEAEIEKIAEQIEEVLLPCCPQPKAVLPPSAEGLAIGRGVAA